MPPSPHELEYLAKQVRMRQPESITIELTQGAVMSLRRRFPPQAIRELVARYTPGESIRALSLEYEVSRSGLRQLLQGEGVALREQGITPEDGEKAVRLYEDGLTIRQVVEQIGYSYGTIRTMLHENGIAMRAMTTTRGQESAQVIQDNSLP